MMGCDMAKLLKCFWCEDGVLGLVIPKRQTKEWCSDKSKYTFGGYDFCDECKKRNEEGIRIIEVSDTPVVDWQPEITEEAYPTGDSWVVNRDALYEGVPDIVLATKEDVIEIGLKEDKE